MRRNEPGGIRCGFQTSEVFLGFHSLRWPMETFGRSLAQMGNVESDQVLTHLGVRAWLRGASWCLGFHTGGGDQAW